MPVRRPNSIEPATVAAQIRTYHAALSPTTRRVLKALEKEVRAAAPRAVPAFSYRIPAFTIDGKVVIWCAGWKEHVGMYPITAAMEEAGGAQLKPYRHAKGTLRFSLDEPLPLPLIRRLIKARVVEMTSE